MLEDVSEYIQFLPYQYEQEYMATLVETDEKFQSKMRTGLADVRTDRYSPLEENFADIEHCQV